jgi:hypothetical protein
MNFIALLDKVFFFLQKLWKSYNEKKSQKEYDDLEASPADWFDNHFDGMSAMPSNDKTQQTNTESK